MNIQLTNNLNNSFNQQVGNQGNKIANATTVGTEEAFLNLADQYMLKNALTLKAPEKNFSFFTEDQKKLYQRTVQGLDHFLTPWCALHFREWQLIEQFFPQSKLMENEKELLLRGLCTAYRESTIGILKKEFLGFALKGQTEIVIQAEEELAQKKNSHAAQHRKNLHNIIPLLELVEKMAQARDKMEIYIYDKPYIPPDSLKPSPSFQQKDLIDFAKFFRFIFEKSEVCPGLPESMKNNLNEVLAFTTAYDCTKKDLPQNPNFENDYFRLLDVTEKIHIQCIEFFTGKPAEIRNVDAIIRRMSELQEQFKGQTTREITLERGFLELAHTLLSRYVVWVDWCVKQKYKTTLHLHSLFSIYFLKESLSQWKSAQKNPLLPLEKSLLIEISPCTPAQNIVNRCQNFSLTVTSKMQSLDLENLSNFLKTLYSVPCWQRATESLKILSNESNQFYREIKTITKSAPEQIQNWLVTIPANTREEQANNISSKLLTELFQVLPLLVSLDELQTFIKMKRVNEPRKMMSIETEYTFMEYMLSTLDEELIDQLYLLTKEALLEGISLVEEPSEEPKQEIIEDEVIAKKAPAQKKLSRSEKRNLTKESNLQKIESKKAQIKLIPDTSRAVSLISPSDKRKAILKVIRDIPSLVKERTSGGHRTFTFDTGKTITMPDHGDTLAPGTVHNINRQITEIMLHTKK